MSIYIFYQGEFAYAAAKQAKKHVAVELFDIDRNDVADIQKLIPKGASGIAYLSGLDSSPLMKLSTIFSEKFGNWTSAYLGTDFFRVGPLVKSSGTCFACSTKRYISAPGSISLSKLETLIQNHNGKDHQAFEFDGYLPSTIQMIVSESLRQIESDDLPAGYIRRVNLLDFHVEEAVATGIHGCDCTIEQYENPGDRFCKNLSSDLSFLFSECD